MSPTIKSQGGQGRRPLLGGMQFPPTENSHIKLQQATKLPAGGGRIVTGKPGSVEDDHSSVDSRCHEPCSAHLQLLMVQATPMPRSGLAPGGVYHAPSLSGRAVRSYRTLSPLPFCKQNGGLLSAALSLPCLPHMTAGFTGHPAVRSPDFPRLIRPKPTNRDRLVTSSLKKQLLVVLAKIFRGMGSLFLTV